jgi:hypothetical protein
MSIIKTTSTFLNVRVGNLNITLFSGTIASGLEK